MIHQWFRLWVPPELQFQFAICQVCLTILRTQCPLYDKLQLLFLQPCEEKATKHHKFTSPVVQPNLYNNRCSFCPPYLEVCGTSELFLANIQWVSSSFPLAETAVLFFTRDKLLSWHSKVLKSQQLHTFIIIVLYIDTIIHRQISVAHTCSL